MKITYLIFFRLVTCENIIDIIVRSRYQKAPCPICGEPEKELFKFPLKKLDTRLIIASKKEIPIKGWNKSSSLYFPKKTLTEKYKNIKPHKKLRKIICVSTWGYGPFNLK